MTSKQLRGALVVDITLGLVAGLMGLGVGLSVRHEQPYCPQEDSCTVDYHDGKWTIKEATPTP